MVDAFITLAIAGIVIGFIAHSIRNAPIWIDDEHGNLRQITKEEWAEMQRDWENRHCAETRR